MLEIPMPANNRRGAIMRCILVVLAFFVCTSIQAAPPLDLANLRARSFTWTFGLRGAAPARQSFPWMQALSKTYEGQGLAIVAVNLDRDRLDADKFLDQFKPTFDVRFDPKGDAAEFYKIKGMPASVLIDRHGTPRYIHVGFRPADAAAFETQLRELLAEK